MRAIYRLIGGAGIAFAALCVYLACAHADMEGVWVVACVLGFGIVLLGMGNDGTPAAVCYFAGCGLFAFVAWLMHEGFEALAIPIHSLTAQDRKECLLGAAAFGLAALALGVKEAMQPDAAPETSRLVVIPVNGRRVTVRVWRFWTVRIWRIWRL